MTEHVCDDRCSWKATDESLGALGFPVRKYERIVGCTFQVREGTSFEEARHRATEAGLLRTCTRTDRLREAGAL